METLETLSIKPRTWEQRPGGNSSDTFTSKHLRSQTPLSSSNSKDGRVIRAYLDCRNGIDTNFYNQCTWLHLLVTLYRYIQSTFP